MPFTPMQHREYRRKLKAKGVCTLCRKKATTNGRAICYDCQEEINSWRKNARKDPARCSDCTRFLDEFLLAAGIKLCSNCNERNRVAVRRYKQRRKHGTAGR